MIRSGGLLLDPQHSFIWCDRVPALIVRLFMVSAHSLRILSPGSSTLAYYRMALLYGPACHMHFGGVLRIEAVIHSERLLADPQCSFILLIPFIAPALREHAKRGLKRGICKARRSGYLVIQLPRIGAKSSSRSMSGQYRMYLAIVLRLVLFLFKFDPNFVYIFFLCRFSNQYGQSF